ncbi:MAG: sulfurtransferase [Betaproteobacteria bacterium]
MYSTLISTAELAARLADPSLVVVDVRHDLAHPDSWGEGEYRVGHLPGARFAHVDRDLSAPKSGTNGRHPLPSPEACAAAFARLGIKASSQVVAYDQGPGTYAARLWWMLRSLGHAAAAVLDGGFAVWTREGRQVTAEVTAFRATSFVPHPIKASVDVEAVAMSLASRSKLLIDARGRERFRGDVEPIDKVAGHIPGAVNRPYTENQTPGGTFKQASELRADFAALIEGREPTAIVHTCGSGITACHNLLAMEHAGLRGTLLYPGSWSEWSADPARPIARGDA